MVGVLRGIMGFCRLSCGPLVSVDHHSESSEPGTGRLPVPGQDVVQCDEKHAVLYRLGARAGPPRLAHVAQREEPARHEHRERLDGHLRRRGESGRLDAVHDALCKAKHEGIVVVGFGSHLPDEPRRLSDVGPRRAATDEVGWQRQRSQPDSWYERGLLSVLVECCGV